MRAVLKDLVHDNDRLSRSLNAYGTPGTPLVEVVVEKHALKAEHELLLTVLRRFWDQIGVLPRSSSMSREEHGLVLDAVVALRAQLRSINLLEAPSASQLLHGAASPSAAMYNAGSDHFDISFTSPRDTRLDVSSAESGPKSSEFPQLAAQRRGLFRSIIQRRV
jgi:hypothetical protein